MKKKDKDKDAALHPDQKFVIGRISRKQIKNAPYTPRQIDDHARKKLAGNIEKKGLLDTLVWNKRTGNLVSGHQRLSILDQRAAKKNLSNYLLDVAMVDLSEPEEKEQNIFFNNPSTQGTYEVDGLGKMLADGDVDYKKAGFDDMDLQLIFEDTEYAVTMFDTDEAPASVQDDLKQLEEIQRMKRERKEHRERDQDAHPRQRLDRAGDTQQALRLVDLLQRGARQHVAELRILPPDVARVEPDPRLPLALRRLRLFLLRAVLFSHP